MVLVLSLIVIIAVAALVGRVCGSSRPGERRSSAGSSWPGDVGGGIDLTDGSVPHHGGFHGHTSGFHGHTSGDSGGGWGGDGGGGFGGGDSGGGGGGD